MRELTKAIVEKNAPREQARLVARIMAKKYPEHEIEFLKAGDECGMGRIKAGFHYLSDHEAGKLLGEKLFAFVKNI